MDDTEVEELVEEAMDDLDATLDDPKLSLDQAKDAWEQVISHANARIAGIRDDINRRG